MIVEYEYDNLLNNKRAIRTITLTNFANQEASRNSGDPEAIVWMGGTEFAIARERVGRIAVFDILPTTTSIDRTTDLKYDIVVEVGTQRISGYDDGIGGSNDGLEGIAYDRANEVFYVAKEYNWLNTDSANGIEAIYSVSYNLATSAWVTAPVDIDGLFDNIGGATPYMVNDGGDKYDISDLFYADDQLFFIKEDGDEFIYRATRDASGNWSMAQSRDLTNGTNIAASEDQIEGLAFDETGLQMFVVAEDDAFYEWRNDTASTAVPVLRSVTEPTSSGNNVNGQVLEVRADVPPGSTVELIRPNQTSPGSNIVLSTSLSTDQTVAQFSITVDNVERVREMEFQTRIVNAAGTPLSATSAIMVPGDFDGDGIVDIDDVELLIDTIYGNDYEVLLDLNGNNLVGFDDIQLWVESLYESFLGDANLDGSVNAADLNVLGVNWLQANRNWSGGDFNGDGVTDSKDLTEQGINWLMSSNKH